MYKWSTLLPVALIAILVLAGCGSDKETSSTGAGESSSAATDTGTTGPTPPTFTGSDEDQVKQVIKTTLATDNPASCKSLETRHFVQQLYFGRNVVNSIAICHLASSKLAADAVQVSKLSVKG